jgi:hypothetical protein
MKMRLMIKLCLVLWFAAPICLGAQEYLRDSPTSIRLRRLYLLAGKVFPISAYPVARKELLAAAEELRAKTLSPEMEKYIEDLIASVEPAPTKGARTAAGLIASYDLRAGDGALMIEDQSKVTNGIDVRRDYVDPPPFLKFAGSLESSTGLSIQVGAESRREWAFDLAKADNIPLLGKEGNWFAMENHFFTKGVLAWENDSFRIALGRDKLHLGGGSGSTLMHAGDLPYLDSLRLTAPLGRWKYDWIVSTISSERARFDDVDTYFPDEFDSAGVAGAFGFEKSMNPSTIFYNVHRAQWSGDRARFAVAGQMLLARKNNMFTLTDFLPVSSWHNAEVSPNNLCLVFDASYAIVPGLAIHATAGFDDITAQMVGFSDASIPTIDAYLVSADLAFDSPGIAWDGFLEGGYTHYLWGNFDGKATSGGDRALLSRAIGRYKTDSRAMLLPLTSPYGPGALWLKARLGAVPKRNVGPSILRFGSDILVLSKNTKANLLETPYRSDEVIAKAPRRISVEAAIEGGLGYRNLDLLLRPSIRIIGGELGFSLGLTAKFTLGEPDGASVNDSPYQL